MNKNPKVSLIIAIYKNIDYLNLILMSVENQSFKGFEVIIAEDDDAEEVREFIDKKRKELSFTIKHISQPDRGFRKNKILNSAIEIASGEYLVFIDGDCILHKNFLSEHIKRVKPDNLTFGRRIMLSEELTKKLTRSMNLNKLNFFSILFSKSRKKEEALYLPFSISNKNSGVLGCNFSVLKDNILKINGFDEDFETPFYGEDTDIWRRFNILGIKMISTRFNTIQYHLYHPSSGRETEWDISEALYKEKEREALWYCKNGLKKHN